MNQLERMQAVNQIAVEDFNRYNWKFTDEAIKLWDEHGEGCFAFFIYNVVESKWWDMVRSN
jgi:hypothetical protein